MPTMPKRTEPIVIRSSAADVVGVPREHLFMCWRAAKDMLEPAIKRSGGWLTTISVVRALENRAMQLWLIFNDCGVKDGETKPIAAAVTEIVTAPSGLKLVRIVLAGGEQRELWTRAISDTVGAWAKENGCKRLQMVGRLGWGPVLAKEGWDKTGVVMELDL